MKKNPENSNGNSAFMSGLLMGGLLGGAVLYFLGTEKGRTQLRTILDALEDLENIDIETVKSDLKDESSEQNSQLTGNLHNVIEKIQSSLPSKDEVQKFFEKEGKALK